MKLSLGTIELDDDTRRLIGEYYGMKGLAPRATCRNFIVGNGTGALDRLDCDRDERAALTPNAS